MRAVLESVGVKNVLAKSKGSSNPHNLVKATFAALLEMRDAFTVAEHRGVFQWIKFLTVSKEIDMAKIRITQVKSKNGKPERQKRTLESSRYP